MVWVWVWWCVVKGGKGMLCTFKGVDDLGAAGGFGVDGVEVEETADVEVCCVFRGEDGDDSVCVGLFHVAHPQLLGYVHDGSS